MSPSGNVSVTGTTAISFSFAASRICSVCGPVVCSLYASSSTSPPVNSSSVSSSTLGGTSEPSSMASLNASGVLLTNPTASNRYSGTGSLIATPAPAYWALRSASRWISSSISACNASALSAKVSALSGSSLANADSISSIASSMVGKS